MPAKMSVQVKKHYQHKKMVKNVKIWYYFSILVLVVFQMLLRTISVSCCTLCFGRAVCRKHELTQFELEMATQDLVSKKQQREELATGVYSCDKT